MKYCQNEPKQTPFFAITPSLQLVVAGTGRTETESVEALAAAIEEELSRCGE